MTTKENIKAILACNFSGFKDEIIETATNRILETVNTTCPNCDSGYAQGYSDGYLKGIEEDDENYNNLLHRFRHLIQSDYIRSFDEWDKIKGDYVRDISEADDEKRLQEIVDKAKTELLASVERPIRCKDCKYQVKEWRCDRRMKEQGYWINGCKKFGEIMGYWGWGGNDNEFCSDAEPRGGANDGQM